MKLAAWPLAQEGSLGHFDSLSLVPNEYAKIFTENLTPFQKNTIFYVCQLHEIKKKSNCFYTVIQTPIGKKIQPFHGTRRAHSNTSKKILKDVRKSLATPGTQQIFRAQVMKYTYIYIESLGFKPSPAVKILSENPGKLFYGPLNLEKIYFFTKIINLFGTSHKPLK